jgi:sugar/nucleoside kinase (ribokinase family)
MTGTSAVEDAVDALIARGVSIVALKQGARGAFATDGRHTHRCPVEPARGGDSIGAGDSFDAGFVAGWLDGLGIQNCLTLACACGAAVAGAVGGLHGQPDRDQMSGLRWDRRRE